MYIPNSSGLLIHHSFLAPASVSGVLILPDPSGGLAVAYEFASDAVDQARRLLL